MAKLIMGLFPDGIALERAICNLLTEYGVTRNDMIIEPITANDPQSEWNLSVVMNDDELHEVETAFRGVGAS